MLYEVITDVSYQSGPDSVLPANMLSQSLKECGVFLRRFKTGTPARVHKRSINFDLLEKQDGDEKIVPFSFENNDELKNQVSCYIAYTNENTHNRITSYNVCYTKLLRNVILQGFLFFYNYPII